MKLIILNVLFLSLTLCNAQKPDPHYCTDNFLFKDVPGGIIKESYSIITTGSMQNIVGCKPVAVEENRLMFLLYNRRHLHTPISISTTNFNELDSTKPIIFQIHGWLCSSSNNRMPELKKAYLSRYDANIIIVDWSQYSMNFYTESFCYIPPIAEIIGDLICNIGEQLNVDISQIHVVGHSLGAQMSGLIGKEVQRQCWTKIGRITGLDPAGPLYQNRPSHERLYKTDANQVDVIHTNMGFMGYFDDCGTSDFYPNCGVHQPGCLNFSKVTSIDTLLNIPFDTVLCSHVRSIDYMIESIKNGNSKFIGKKCDFIPTLPLIGRCGNLILTRDEAEMGENCPPNPHGRKFCLSTHSKAPFARD